MKTVVITGGIGCGKSWVATALGSLNASFRYSADEAIHAAYDDPAIRSKIAKALNLPDTDHDLSGKELRRAIRPRVMTDRSAKSTLEEILHPMARHSFLETRRLANDAGAKLLVAEIPLYYKTGAAFDGDVVVVVAASRSLNCEDFSSIGRLTCKPRRCCRCRCRWTKKSSVPML